MRALVIDAPGSARVIERPVPAPVAGDVLVRVAHAGLCGTDLGTFRGSNPLVTYPRVIGHEISGTVEALGTGVDTVRVGARVAISPYKNCGRCAACRVGRPNACRNNETLGVQRDGAAAEFAVVPAARLYTSETIGLDLLALVEPFSIGMHAVRRARVTSDDTVAVIGCGGVGAGAVAAAASCGARVIAIDVDAAKLALAESFGAAMSFNGTDPNIGERVREVTGGEGPEVVIEAVGSAATYGLALELVASCGRVACLGWVKGEVSLQARQIVAKEMEILGSRNATDEFADVIALFESKAIDPLRLVSDRVSLEEAPGMFARWAEHPASVGKVLVSLPA